ncbi:fibronectin-like, partial [Ixodes scapularis]|uniref:fibronectin-like n=1 Tax=Ixodes scapularis TaxID=6945 RepID=UPI001A9DAD4F
LQAKVPHATLPTKVTNLRVLFRTPSSVSLAWNRPPAVFEGYKVIFRTSGTRIGTCLNGTTLDPTQTQITCENLESCTTLDVTVFTQKSSSSSEISAGVTLSDIQVPGKDPGPPMDIKHDPIAPRKTKLHWTPPQLVWEPLGPYKVTVCPNPDSCPSSQQVGCHEEETRAMSLVLNTTPVTDYCVVIHSTASCFGQVHKSQAAFKTFKTRAFAPGKFTVTAAATSPSSIRLLIDPPKEKNGNLDGCSSQCSSSENKNEINCAPDNVDIEVKDLIPSSQYTCRVTFYNNHEGQRLETTQEVGVLTPNRADQQSSYLWLIFLIMFLFYFR